MHAYKHKHTHTHTNTHTDTRARSHTNTHARRKKAQGERYLQQSKTHSRHLVQTARDKDPKNIEGAKCGDLFS